MSASRNLPDAVSAPVGSEDEVTDPVARAKLKKAPNAFRTISEVADDLHIPQHVLRFWETKFPQVKPLKRGGGRRYYRPDDIGLLRRISDLLYIQGYTIKGVQRLLREGGGALSDDIPPPAPEEREPRVSAEPERQAAIPGLAATQAAPVAAAPRPLPRLDAMLRSARPPGQLAGAGDAADAVMLRAVLQDVLQELETLRALLAARPHVAA